MVGRIRVTILVIEDDSDLSILVSELLREEGYEVAVASTGAAAFEWLEMHTPSIIVLDMMVSDLSGWDFDDRRRCDARLASIPMVVTSGLPPKELAARPLDVVARIAKPYRIEALLAAIRLHARPVPAFDPAAESRLPESLP